MTNEKCECCGASLKKYFHRITPGLVRTLVEVYKTVSAKGNVVSKKDLKLNHSQYGNFQKLRFHGLIAKYKVEGVWLRGQWVLTRRGGDFLKGQIQIPVKVQTFRNQVVDHDTELVTVRDVMKSEPYWETDFQYDVFEPKQTTLL